MDAGSREENASNQNHGEPNIAAAMAMLWM
jgi:hypothetical protein